MAVNLRLRKGQKRIGLWGPRAAGKTVYIVSLYLASRMSGYDDWFMSLDDVDDDARALFDGMAANLLSGNFPAPTPPALDDLDIYNFVFYPNNKNLNPKSSRASDDKLDIFWKQIGDFLTKEPSVETKSEFPGIAVSFTDVAGEKYLLEKSNSTMWNHLAGCQGLICLIDPEDCLENFQSINRLGGLLKQKIIREAPEALIERRYLPHYISLCFSKMDRPEWREFIDRSDPNPEELIIHLEKKVGFNIRKIFETEFSPDRTTFHYVSSIGLNANFDGGSKGEKGIRIKPYNIFAPLNEWLF